MSFMAVVLQTYIAISTYRSLFCIDVGLQWCLWLQIARVRKSRRRVRIAIATTVASAVALELSPFLMHGLASQFCFLQFFLRSSWCPARIYTFFASLVTVLTYWPLLCAPFLQPSASCTRISLVLLCHYRCGTFLHITQSAWKFLSRASVSSPKWGRNAALLCCLQILEPFNEQFTIFKVSRA